jgi:hypothetical protein
MDALESAWPAPGSSFSPAFPMLILMIVVAILFRDGEYGIPAIIGAALAIALGPAIYRVAQYARTRQ